MSLRFHEIAEADRRILDPLSAEKLRLVGEIADLDAETWVLDLACGKGEFLCRWAEEFGVAGVGVDASAVFLDAARERATELGVEDRVSFQRGDAAEFDPEPGGFDVAACIGATWIFDGLEGTIAHLCDAVTDDGLVLVGEPFWRESPPPEAVDALVDGDENAYASLAGTLDRFEAAGVELVEMVVSNRDEWDRYEASQWRTVERWLREHPDDPDADALRAWRDENRRAYLEYGRRYVGWGVFVLRPRTGGP